MGPARLLSHSISLGLIATAFGQISAPKAANINSYKLALATTGTIKPRIEMGSQEAVVQTTADASAKDDQTLANGMLALNDSIWLIFAQEEQDSLLSAATLSPEAIKGLASALESSKSDLSKITFTESGREKARKDVLQGLGITIRDLNQMADAITIAKKDGWTAEAQDMAKKAVDESQAIPNYPSVTALCKDPTFQKQLPHSYLETEGAVESPEGFKLGAANLIGNTLLLVYVYPGSLAEKLKFQALDRIEQINGTTPRDLDEFKQILKNAAGQSVHIKVETGKGEQKEYDVEVPANLTDKAAPLAAPQSAPAEDAGTPKMSDEDETLQLGIITRYDAILTADYMQNEMLNPESFKRTQDKRANAMILQVKSAVELLALTQQTDPTKEAAEKELSTVMSTILDALGDFNDALDKARALGRWNPDSSALGTKAIKILNSMAAIPHVVALSKDPAFQKFLPPLYLEQNGYIADPAGFDLGAYSFLEDPLYIVSIKPDSVAAKLGFENLESIEEFDGQKPDDIDDLKQMIKKAAGKQVTIKVQPEFGPEKTVQATVPANLQP